METSQLQAVNSYFDEKIMENPKFKESIYLQFGNDKNLATQFHPEVEKDIDKVVSRPTCYVLVSSSC